MRRATRIRRWPPSRPLIILLLTLLLPALLLPALLLPVRPAAAQQLISDVSQDRIEIEYSFAGVEILVYGAVLYPRGMRPPRQPGIAVIVRGPTQPITVRRKERVAGIWLNRPFARFQTAPSFYRLATTAPVDELVDERTAAIHEIGLDNLQLSPGSSDSPAEIDAFEQGLLELRQRSGIYAQEEGGVVVTENTLYRARIAVPSSVPAGVYTIEVLLIEDGDVIATSTRELEVAKSGFERAVFIFSQENSLAYGLLAVGFALLSGWVAGLVVRR